jgi:ABC-type glycerol-3-phosphate transport system permease component
MKSVITFIRWFAPLDMFLNVLFAVSVFPIPLLVPVCACWMAVDQENNWAAAIIFAAAFILSFAYILLKDKYDID